MWYEGPCLLECLNAIKFCEGNLSGSFRLSISDKWKVSCGVCAEGKIVSGSISIGQEIAVMP